MPRPQLGAFLSVVPVGQKWPDSQGMGGAPPIQANPPGHCVPVGDGVLVRLGVCVLDGVAVGVLGGVAVCVRVPVGVPVCVTPVPEPVAVRVTDGVGEREGTAAVIRNPSCAE